ncbi:MAG: EamA family transporter [Vibrio sp.]
MNTRSLGLILLVVLIWGANFVVISVGVKEVPPFFMGGLRFLFVVFPLVFFLPKPQIPWRWMILYGLSISFGLFGFLFYALYIGMPSGQASLVLQSQVFVTALLGMAIYKDKLTLLQVFGGIIALSGIGILLYGVLETDISFLGYFFTVAGACSWAVGNICSRAISIRFPNTNMMHLVVWGGLVPVFPFFFTSYLLEDHQQVIQAITHPSEVAIFSLAYLVILSSLFGYSTWGYLIAKHGTANVVPFALLVPVVGLISGWIALNETLTLTQTIGCGVVILGLCTYSFHQKLRMLTRSRKAIDIS